MFDGHISNVCISAYWTLPIFATRSKKTYQNCHNSVSVDSTSYGLKHTQKTPKQTIKNSTTALARTLIWAKLPTLTNWSQNNWFLQTGEWLPSTTSTKCYQDQFLTNLVETVAFFCKWKILFLHVLGNDYVLGLRVYLPFLTASSCNIQRFDFFIKFTFQRETLDFKLDVPK